MATSFLYGMFGVSAAFAVFCLSYFLTGTACNKVTELSTGQHALCRAGASTGRIVVTAGSGHGAVSYHLREEPHVLPGSGVEVLRNTSTKLPSAGLAALSFTMLPGSWLRYTVRPGIDSYFYITDYAGYFNLRFGRAHTAFVESGRAQSSFSGTFARNESERDGVVAYLVVRNPEIKESSVAWEVEGVLAQYDVSGAVETCAGRETCEFDDISPSSVVLTTVNATAADTSSGSSGRAADSTVEISQVTYYHSSTQAGWAVAGLVVFYAVLAFFVPGLHKINKKARKKSREQRELARKKLEDDDYEDDD